MICKQLTRAASLAWLLYRGALGGCDILAATFGDESVLAREPDRGPRRLQPLGYRYTYWTPTTYLDRRLLADMAAVILEEMASLRIVASVLPSMPWQIIKARLI
ncbi:hypothetical protein DL767_006127 [Monosporascus sp. MG133]|nr:hypothetical protein DL767_006127 [Monosporascus sp. MG133]